MPPNDCRAPLARRTNGCAICPPEALRAAKRTTGINIPLPPRSKPTRQDHLNAPRRNPLDSPFQPFNPRHRVTNSVAPSGSYLNWKILSQPCPTALKHDRAESDALAGSPRFRRWGGQIAVCWRQVRAGCVGGVGSVKRASSGGRSSGTIAGRAFPGAEKAVRGGFWGRLRQVTRVAVERVGRGARASAQDRARGQRRNFG